MGRLLLVSFLSVLPLLLHGQIFPAEGSKLNYRVVGLSFLSKKGADNYVIQIATGNCNSIDSFNNNIVRTIDSKKNKTIVEVPSFGCNYTWRVTYNIGKKNFPEKTLHHFSTLPLPETGKQRRLRVLQPVDKNHKDAYVFLDSYKELFDMNGEPVWFISDDTSGNAGKLTGGLIRDLKISPQGTITFLGENQGGYEINYNDDLLWKTPDDGKVSGEKTESFHHEFTRLSNGHYMILGQETGLWNHRLPSPDSSFEIIPLSAKVKRGANAQETQVPLGTVIEYDQDGNVVWYWKSSDYFRHSDIYYHKEGITVHENAFFFDEKNKAIYVSFRDISRIVKVKYPEGNVIDVYGENFTKNSGRTTNELFYFQHSVRKSNKGYLYLYDNNTLIAGNFPKILKLEEPQTPGGDLKEIWEYDCTGEGVLPEEDHQLNKKSPDKNHIYDFQSGGNVIELPDDCFFVNMSGKYDKVFILNPNKEILWSAIPEEWDSKGWHITPQYRASIISNKEMEALVWNTTDKNSDKDKTLAKSQSPERPSTK